VEVEESVRDHGDRDAAGALVCGGDDDAEHNHRDERGDAVMREGEKNGGDRKNDEAGKASAQVTKETGAKNKFLGDGSDEGGEGDEDGGLERRVGVEKKFQGLLRFGFVAEVFEQPGPDENERKHHCHGDEKGGETGGGDVRDRKRRGRWRGVGETGIHLRADTIGAE
jgi:hypothetical protein